MIVNESLCAVYPKDLGGLEPLFSKYQLIWDSSYEQETHNRASGVQVPDPPLSN